MTATTYHLDHQPSAERRRVADRRRARADVLWRLLPVLDELDRALEHLPRDLEEHPWAEGLALSRYTLTCAFRDMEIERIGTEGERFDPAHHQAVYYDERAEVAEPRVSRVILTGYVLGDHLLRPAKVGVVGPPALLAGGEDETIAGAESRDNRIH